MPYGITQCYLPPDTSELALPNPSQTSWYSIYLPWMDGRLSRPRWLVTYRDGLPACRRSPVQPCPVSINFVDQANALTTTLCRHQHQQNGEKLTVQRKSTCGDITESRDVDWHVSRTQLPTNRWPVFIYQYTFYRKRFNVKMAMKMVM